MGSGTYERQGNYLSTGASGGYTFIRFPYGETFHPGSDPNVSNGYAELYFETGFYVNAGNFYGATFNSEGSTLESYNVYGPDAYHVRGWTIQVPWNGYRHFWEKNGYTSYSHGTLSSVLEFDWYPNLPTYTIEYNANGGTSAPSSHTKEYGTPVSLSSSAPTRTNYNFLGWATSDSALTPDYQAGGTYSTNANVTLYAVWELAFISPTAVLSAYRVTAGTTTRDPNGTEVYATIEWAANPINSTDNVLVNSVTATLTEDGVSVTAPTVVNPTLPALSGTSTIRFTANTAKTYSLTITVTDTNGLSTTKSSTISNVKYPIYVYHNNDEDFVKIENLEFGNPAFARAGLEVAQVHILYYNDYNRSTTTIPLTYDNAAVNVSDYDWLKICYTSNVDQWASQDVFKPLGKYVSLFTLANWSGDNNAWLKYSMYYIDTSEIRLHNNGWQLALNSGGIAWGDQSGPFEFITQVVGYKL